MARTPLRSPSGRARLLRRRRRAMVRGWQREARQPFYVIRRAALAAAPVLFAVCLSAGAWGVRRDLGTALLQAARRWITSVSVCQRELLPAGELPGEEARELLWEGAGFSAEEGRLFFFWMSERYEQEAASD